MTRILYLLVSNGGLTGGQKMILRHVETLRELGFDAACLLSARSQPPAGIRHSAPILPPGAPEPDDVFVIGDDAVKALHWAHDRHARTVVFAQGGYSLAADGVVPLDRYPAGRLPTIMAVAPTLASRIRRIYPQAEVEVVPCFADERVFRPAPAKRLAITGTPAKRPFEVRAIHGMFLRMHPRHANLPWPLVAGETEDATARIFGQAAVYLSLARVESVGMATLEAMASGCLCAGFLGGGGEQYGTAENGFWVPDEACEAAADALAEATDLAATGGPALARMIDAGRATAEHWSYVRFRDRLEEVWTRLAPEARTLRTA